MEAKADALYVTEEETVSSEDATESDAGSAQGSNEDSAPELDLDNLPEEEITLGFKTDPAARIFIPTEKKRVGKRRLNFAATSLGRRYAKNKKIAEKKKKKKNAKTKKKERSWAQRPATRAIVNVDSELRWEQRAEDRKMLQRRQAHRDELNKHKLRETSEAIERRVVSHAFSTLPSRDYHWLLPRDTSGPTVNTYAPETKLSADAKIQTVHDKQAKREAKARFLMLSAASMTSTHKLYRADNETIQEEMFIKLADELLATKNLRRTIKQWFHYSGLRVVRHAWDRWRKRAKRLFICRVHFYLWRYNLLLRKQEKRRKEARKRPSTPFIPERYKQRIAEKKRMRTSIKPRRNSGIKEFKSYKCQCKGVVHSKECIEIFTVLAAMASDDDEEEEEEEEKRRDRRVVSTRRRNTFSTFPGSPSRRSPSTERQQVVVRIKTPRVHDPSRRPVRELSPDISSDQSPTHRLRLGLASMDTLKSELDDISNPTSSVNASVSEEPSLSPPQTQRLRLGLVSPLASPSPSVSDSQTPPMKLGFPSTDSKGESSATTSENMTQQPASPSPPRRRLRLGLMSMDTKSGFKDAPSPRGSAEKTKDKGKDIAGLRVLESVLGTPRLQINTKPSRGRRRRSFLGRRPSFKNKTPKKRRNSRSKSKFRRASVSKRMSITVTQVSGTGKIFKNQQPIPSGNVNKQPTMLSGNGKIQQKKRSGSGKQELKPKRKLTLSSSRAVNMRMRNPLKGDFKVPWVNYSNRAMRR